MAYNEEDHLMLSGIQHFRFCRRQWALIHIEGLWAENYRTADGSLVHERAHDPSLNETRKDTIITRGVNVFSHTLGISGQCDIVEYHRCEAGIALSGREGLWVPFPVEYKRGSPREDDADKLQLCAEAMCLEETLCCKISQGAIYYNEIRRRVLIDLDFELREKVRGITSEMHDLYQKRYTPKSKPTKACNACSLRDICLPGLAKNKSVAEYIRDAVEDIQ